MIKILIWNDLSTNGFLFFLRGQRELRSRRLLRRLITLIFAGRNRIIVIRRELPRTSSARFSPEAWSCSWAKLASARIRT